MEQLCNKCGKLKDISEFEIRKDVKSRHSKYVKSVVKFRLKKDIII